MASKIDWEARIGRRLRLRDLYVLFTVVECGSMAAAAAQLRVSQPSISEVIAGLEHTLAVRLLDRGPKGVEPTVYARALLSRARTAFDELRQGIRDIEFLSEPSCGEIHIGAPESIASSILPTILQRLSQEYPRISTQVDAGSTEVVIKRLLERELDVVLVRGARVPADESVIDKLDTEVLFNDELVVVASGKSKWARRRKLTLADLVNERWVLSLPGTWNYTVASDAFRACGLDMPAISLNTLSIHLRCNLAAQGSAITVLPRSVLQLYGKLFFLQELATELPRRPWPVKIVKLKNRTLSPVVERFLHCARAVSRAMKPA
jgi:DNA-binding transcriptional LysR family regulator